MRRSSADCPRDEQSSGQRGARKAARDVQARMRSSRDRVAAGPPERKSESRVSRAGATYVQGIDGRENRSEIVNQADSCRDRSRRGLDLDRRMLRGRGGSVLL